MSGPLTLSVGTIAGGSVTVVLPLARTVLPSACFRRRRCRIQFGTMRAVLSPLRKNATIGMPLIPTSSLTTRINHGLCGAPSGMVFSLCVLTRRCMLPQASSLALLPVVTTRLPGMLRPILLQNMLVPTPSRHRLFSSMQAGITCLFPGTTVAVVQRAITASP